MAFTVGSQRWALRFAIRKLRQGRTAGSSLAADTLEHLLLTKIRNNAEYCKRWRDDKKLKASRGEK